MELAEEVEVEEVEEEAEAGEEAGERILAQPPVQVQFPVATQAWQDEMVGVAEAEVGVLLLLHPRLGAVVGEVADTIMFVTVCQTSHQK